MPQIVAHFAIVGQEVNVSAKGTWHLVPQSQMINVSCFNLYFSATAVRDLCSKLTQTGRDSVFTA